jgi:DUF4097 and DUF4098 domain-containing protein YvlB
MKIRFARISRAALAGSAAIAFVLAGLAYGSDENAVAKSFTVQPGGRLVVNTDLGSIEVRGVEANSVDITVSREVRRGNTEETLAEFKLDFEQKGNDIFVTGDGGRQGSHGFWNDIGNRLRVRFVITVPKVYNLELKTSGGSVDVAEIQGRVESRTSGGSLFFDRITGDVLGRTSGGSIRVGAVDGEVEVHTSGGGIKIDETTGNVVARTSGGSIEISKAGGDVDAETSGGSIRAGDIRGGLEADTSGGSVTATLSVQPQTRCKLTASGGSITIYLAENVGMDVDARSSGGGVSTDFPVTIQGPIRRDTLRAKINGGGPELYLRTSGGGIHIRKK